MSETAAAGQAVGRIKASDEDLGVNAEMDYVITNPEAAAVFSISTDSEHGEGIISLKQVAADPHTHCAAFHFFGD